MQRYKKNHNSNTLRGSKTGRTILCMLLFSISLLTLSAQQQTITFRDSKLTISEIFKAIEQQTGFNIAYNRSKLNAAKEVKLSKTAASLNDILVESLAGSNQTYKINGKHIVITPQDVVAQTLRGKVVDDQTGVPIVNADVTIAGKPNLKTKTDKQGRFSIKNIPLGSQTVAIVTDGYIMRKRGIELTTSKPADMQIMLKAEKPAEPIVEPAVIIEEVMQMVINNDAQQIIPIDTIRQEILPVIRIAEPEQPAQRKHPVFAQKTNLLYWATSTPNIGAEVYLAKKWTAEATLGYNPWQLSGRSSLRHWLVQPELRYWTCQSFEGHFFGLHGIYGKFNVGELSFINALKDYTYKGNMYGAGLSYGYHFPLKGKWGLELTLGLGYIHLDYDKYICKDCLELQGSYKRDYWGPTKAGISLIYMLE